MNSEKRILILPSWYPPDGGYFFKEFSEAMHQAGWHADVMVNRVVGVRKLIQAGPSALKGYRVENENGLRVVRSVYLKIPGSEKFNIASWARHTCRLYGKYERQFGKPDLILCHSVTWAGFAASLIMKKYGIPYLIVEHRSFFTWRTEKARAMVRPYYLPFFEKAYRGCSRLVLVSESLLTGLKALMPWLEEKTMVIPNMIREDMFLPPTVPRTSDPFIFFWAGRLEHVKGLDLLLDAFSELAGNRSENIILRLAGRGSLRAELEQRANAWGLDQIVSFLGRISREEMQKELQGANCFVLPSRYEAFGAVLIEAMSSGLPVIATRSGGPDSIVSKENGILIDAENRDQLLAALNRMLDQYGSFTQEHIRKSTLKRYGSTAVLNAYDRLIKQLITDQG
jgi:glycosyltransferase involved in cell wall biosynthesis